MILAKGFKKNFFCLQNRQKIKTIDIKRMNFRNRLPTKIPNNLMKKKMLPNPDVHTKLIAITKLPSKLEKKQDIYKEKKTIYLCTLIYGKRQT